MGASSLSALAEGRRGHGSVRSLVLLCPLALLAAAVRGEGTAPAASLPPPFSVEYSYTVAWGHQEEFLELFRANHFPVLKALQAQGYIRSMTAVAPYHHVGERERWDFRLTIEWRDLDAAHGLEAETEAIVTALYPDRATWSAEERRRFSLLTGHTDVPVFAYDLSDW